MLVARLFALLQLAVFSYGFPEVGYWKQPLDKDLFYFTKTIDTSQQPKLSIRVYCASKQKIDVQYLLIMSKCANEFNAVNSDIVSRLFDSQYKGTDDFKIYKIKGNPICENGTSFSREISIPSDEVSNGAFMAAMKLMCNSSSDCLNGENSLVVELKTAEGYLSPLDSPLQKFYGLLTGLNLLVLITWVTLLVIYRSSVLRIQYCIGLVILLSFVESTTYVGEYLRMSIVGEVNFVTVIFSAVVYTVKSALSRLLLLFVCLGYGTTKARLGTLAVRVWLIVSFYLCVAGLYNVRRTLMFRMEASNSLIIVLVMLAVIDMVIVWWSMSYLLETLNQVQTRQNTGKTRIYRSFTATLTIMSIVSLVYMIVISVLVRRSACFKHWKLLWVDEAFWHCQFFVILCVIVYLWRPGRDQYAYSVFIDPKEHDRDMDLDQSLLNNDALEKATEKINAYLRGGADQSRGHEE